MNRWIKELVNRYPSLEDCIQDVEQAYLTLVECYEAGGKLLIAGNGGSAADAEHIVGELMKGFVLPRKISGELSDKMVAIDDALGNDLSKRLQGALPAIALSSHSSLTTAIANDLGGHIGYAQQLHGYGTAKDVFLAISTSGNSRNILQGAVVARAKGLKIIGLTGKSGGRLSGIADITIKVPEVETYRIQELHLPVYHCLCMMLEEYFFGKDT